MDQTLRVGGVESGERLLGDVKRGVDRQKFASFEPLRQ